MEHDIIHYAKHRHTTKAYNATKKISAENMAKIKDLLRYAPSSTNSQPWHFIIAATQEGKERIAKENESLFPFNNPSIRAASHVVIFCTRLSMDDEHLSKVLAHEEADGRFIRPGSKEGMEAGRKLFTNIHKHDYKDVQHWMDKQVYLNVGQFLLGVSTLGIDATPMEGIDVKSIDAALGLREKGYTSLVAVTLGYHDVDADFNALLPKSRLPFSEILTEI